MNSFAQRDAHASPPPSLKGVYKHYQTSSINSLAEEEALIDLANGLSESQSRILIQSGFVPSEDVVHVCQEFNALGSLSTEETRISVPATACLIFESVVVPGLYIYPSLIPPEIQLELLSRLLHRDLSIPCHKTNVHTHYNVYSRQGQTTVQEKNPVAPKDYLSGSFFMYPPASMVQFEPKDPQLHKPLSIPRFLKQKLRWITLGGQYDWTSKAYPLETPPTFPTDISQLLQGLFPDLKPHAAIVNLYSPGDTLALHRDVSEQSDKGLVSVSLGCDGIFVIGLEDAGDAFKDKGTAHLAIRLHSGDVVYMSNEARFAWHGVPKIIGGTCPQWMRNWPANTRSDAAEHSKFEQWRGWMENKRINLNVRQMYD